MVYRGMIGIIELAQFVKYASADELDEFHLLAETDRTADAWGLVYNVLGIDPHRSSHD